MTSAALIARKIRVLRVRRRWRQLDLARRARVSRSTVMRIEAGLLDGVTLGALRATADALGAFLLVDLRWSGAELDRLLDAHHAALQEWLAALLRRCGWEVRVEVSFNHFGDRGRYDLLAFHPATGTVLVVEVKTAIADIQELLGRLDVKVRTAVKVARGLGWGPRRVVPMLLVAESSSARQRLAAHASLFARFDVRGREALRWIRTPVLSAARPSGLLAFRDLRNARQNDLIRVQRVRRAVMPTSATSGASGAVPRR
jgi:transcriptional regulator with XRE-family HTH domain